MAPLAFTLSVGCCIIVLGDLDMRCRLSLVLMYVSLLLLVGCGKNFSLSHKTTPSFLTPHTGQTPYTLAPYTEFALPQLSEKDCASGPQGITVGPDGALWFTEPELNKIGRITTQGQVSEFALPIARMGPAEITAGPDGALWFTQPGPNQIGRITTQGQISEFALPSSLDPPSNGGGITTGPDGALWFTQGWGPLGRIPTQGHITLFSPPYTGGPGRIVAGPDGALWMTEVDPHAGLIGRFSPSSARVPESRKVSAATFPCPVVTPIPTAPSTPSPSGS